ncbi:MAG: response regulator transcription factor [Bacteroidales bacterium]|nr:response regulator transcription factor [Bacteroidales bacterium]
MEKRIVIIEDEALAAANLQRTIAEAMPDGRVVAVLPTIEESVDYFRSQATANGVDLVLMDIHLADGSAFRIFDQVRVESPVVFTTAYDQYALDAFRAGGFDYLLKPVSAADLRRTLDRLDRLARPANREADLAALVEALAPRRRYRSVFLIPMGDKLVPLEVRNVAYFVLDQSTVVAALRDGSRRSLDLTLDALASQLDPNLFFRANRQYIVSRDSIAEIALWPIGKLRLTLVQETPQPIIVSKARNAEFRRWYAGEQ